MRQHKMLPQCKNRVQPPPPRNAKEIWLKPGLGVPKPDAPDKIPIYSKAAILLSATFLEKHYLSRDGAKSHPPRRLKRYISDFSEICSW